MTTDFLDLKEVNSATEAVGKVGRFVEVKYNAVSAENKTSAPKEEQSKHFRATECAFWSGAGWNRIWTTSTSPRPWAR